LAAGEKEASCPRGACKIPGTGYEYLVPGKEGPRPAKPTNPVYETPVRLNEKVD